jgi:hypothetical protein
LREDVKIVREEFWGNGAVKQQRPSAKRMKVKGTGREKERPRNNEVIGTSNGPAKDGGNGKDGVGWPGGDRTVPVSGSIGVYCRI